MEVSAMTAKMIRQSLAFVVVLALLLFLPAGRLDWPGAWLFLIESSLLGLVIGLALARRDPALLAERMRPILQRQQPLWDKRLMKVALVVWIGWLFAMGLERRFDVAHLPGWTLAPGALLVALCFWVVHITFRENSFAAPVVKVQTERGHKVISTGPYAIVRHPMYAGAALYFLGAPLMLGSLWGLVASPAAIAILGVRAVLEERTLKQALPGYGQYMDRVRYRLMPGLW